MHLPARLAVVASFLALAAACGKSQTGPEADYASRMAAEHRNDAPVASPAAQGQPSTPVHGETVQYATVGGRPVQGYLSYPTAAEGGLPGILMFHEWWGLNDNIRSMADQLAGQGYVVLAADLYGGKVADTPELARTLMEQALGNKDAIGQNLRQAQAYLTEQVKATRIGTIGWCFGGGVSLQAALQLADQVDAAVVYYGHVSADPEALKPLKAPLLGLFGGADAGIPLESVQAFEKTLKALGKDATVVVYEGADHAFANPSGKNYKADAAADAWQKATAFLAQHLKPV